MARIDSRHTLLPLHDTVGIVTPLHRAILTVVLTCFSQSSPLLNELTKSTVVHRNYDLYIMSVRM